MALLNLYTTGSWLELDLYYSVSSIDLSGHIALDGYISKEARDEGKAPVNRIVYNYDTAPNKMVNDKLITSENYISKAELGLATIYEFVKSKNEFINSTDA
jgi:hypothetical protein